MHFTVDPHSHVPPSQQLVAGVLDAIARGDLSVGDRLPPVRALATQVLVNPNTVSKAWRDLERMGVTAGRNGSGVFVTADGPRIARDLRLAATLVELRAAVRTALGAGHDADALRTLIATELERERVGGGT